MSAFSDALEQDLLNFIFRGTAIAITAPLKVSLHTADPGDTGASEVSTAVWTNYARATVNRDGATAPFFTAAAADGTGHSTGNSGEVSFGTATISGTAPVVSHVGIWDSAATPKLIGAFALSESKTVNNGDPVKFAAAGDLKFIVR